MHIQSLTPEASLASLRSAASGLTQGEASRRLAEFGANRLEAVAGEPVLVRFAREFTHFFALLLWLGAGLAFVADAFDPGQGMNRLGLAIIGVIVVNGSFSFWQEYRAERAIAELRALLPQRVTVWRDGVQTEVLASALVPGDVIVLAEGARVPADCRLVEAPATESRLILSGLVGDHRHTAEAIARQIGLIKRADAGKQPSERLLNSETCRTTNSHNSARAVKHGISKDRYPEANWRSACWNQGQHRILASPRDPAWVSLHRVEAWVPASPIFRTWRVIWTKVPVIKRPG
ncbi:MAG: cation-transporting P-type ATPase [Thiobacillus sp.]